MNTEKILNRFRTMLNMEKNARARYIHYIGKISDKTIKKELSRIKKDEEKHVAMLKEMIGFFST